MESTSRDDAAKHHDFIYGLQERCSASLSPDDISCIREVRDRLGYGGCDPSECAERLCILHPGIDQSESSSMITVLIPYLHDLIDYHRSERSTSAKSVKPILYLVCNTDDMPLAELTTRSMNLCAVNSLTPPTPAPPSGEIDVVLVGDRNITARRTNKLGQVKSTINAVEQEKCKLQIKPNGDIESHSTLANTCNLLRQHFTETNELPLFLKCMQTCKLDKMLVPIDADLSHRPVVTVPAFSPELAMALLKLCDESASATQVPSYIREVLVHVQLGGDPKCMLDNQCVRKISLDRRHGHDHTHLAFFGHHAVNHDHLERDLFPRMISLIHPRLGSSVVVGGVRRSTDLKAALGESSGTITFLMLPGGDLSLPTCFRDACELVHLAPHPSDHARACLHEYSQTLMQCHPRSGHFDSEASLLQVTKVDREMSIADIICWVARVVNIMPVRKCVGLIGGTVAQGKSMVGTMRGATHLAILRAAEQYRRPTARNVDSFFVAARLLNNFIVGVLRHNNNNNTLWSLSHFSSASIADLPTLIDDIILRGTPVRLEDDIVDFWLEAGELFRLNPFADEADSPTAKIDALSEADKRRHLQQSGIQYGEVTKMVLLRVVGMRLSRECGVLCRNFRDWVCMRAMCRAVQNESSSGNSTEARDKLHKALSSWKFGPDDADSSCLRITRQEAKYIQAQLESAGLAIECPGLHHDRLATEDALSSMLRAHTTTLQASAEDTQQLDGVHNQITIKSPGSPLIHTTIPCTTASLQLMRQFVAGGAHCTSEALQSIRGSEDLIIQIFKHLCIDPPVRDWYSSDAEPLSDCELKGGFEVQPVLDTMKGYMTLNGCREMPLDLLQREVGPELYARLRQTHDWDWQIRNGLHTHDRLEREAYRPRWHAEHHASGAYIIADFTHPTSCTQHIVCQPTALSVEHDIRLVIASSKRHSQGKRFRNTHVVVCTPAPSVAFGEICSMFRTITGLDVDIHDVMQKQTSDKMFADLKTKFCTQSDLRELGGNTSSFCVAKTPDARRTAPSMKQLTAQLQTDGERYAIKAMSDRSVHPPRPLSKVERLGHGCTSLRIIAAIRRCRHKTHRWPQSVHVLKSVCGFDKRDMSAIRRLECTPDASDCFLSMVKRAKAMNQHMSKKRKAPDSS